MHWCSLNMTESCDDMLVVGVLCRYIKCNGRPMSQYAPFQPAAQARCTRQTYRHTDVRRAYRL